MQIDSLHVENFKSIREVDVEFSDLNVFVGQNAAGKSNLFEVFQFLKDAENEGIDDAIQMQGDHEYLRNKIIGKKEDLKISVEFCPDKEFKSRIEGAPPVKIDHRIATGEILYSQEKTTNFNYKINSKFKTRNDIDEMGLSSEMSSDGMFEFDEYFQMVFDDYIDEGEVKVRPSAYFGEEEPQFGSTYDIEPKRVQGGTTLKGKTELESDGSNLALVIRNIVEDDEQREKFVSLVSDVLPFVADSDVETMPDQSLFLKILEEFEPGEDQYIPASMLSDGTLRVLATIVLLYFSDERILFIEEPGRNVHPSLIANLMAKVRDVAENTDKQIFVTTHNVEVLKHTPLESIRLVSRGDEGFTQVEKPAENERVQTFLENDIGIEELYTENLLGE